MEFNFKKNIATVFTLLFCCFLSAQILPSFGDSRTGTTGFQFLKIVPDAYSAGLANATSAKKLGVFGLYTNPAAIIFTDSNKYHVNINNLSYFANINMQSFGAVYNLDEDKSFGISLLYLNTNQMQVTTEFQPFGTGQTFKAVNFAFGLTYAQRLTEFFNYGINIKLANESIAAVNASTILFDFGFQYFIDIAKTRFAVSLSNFGFNSKPNGEIEVLSLEGLTSVSEFQQINIPAVFKFGLVYNAFEKEKHLIDVMAQLNHPTDNNETVNFGVEYVYNNLLSVKTGYQFGQDELTYPSFGLGVNLKRYFGNVRLDYAFTAKQILGSNNRISLALSF